MILPKEYYQGEDVVAIAKDLLGKVIYTQFDGIVTSGKIVETEAYNGRCDHACHAFGGRRTARTEVMYQEGGVAYVYLCYGIHSLFNIVTNGKDKADAVLVRAIEPMDGIEEMMKRRGMTTLKSQLTAGPGALSEALGIKTKHTGMPLSGSEIWIEDQQILIPTNEVVIGTRVGVAYAKEDAFLPWRFRVKNNPYISLAK